MIQEAIENRIEALTPTYRKFIFSIFTEVMTDIQANKLGLLPKQKAIYENGLILYLLFFISMDELISFVSRECEVEPSVAENSVKQVLYQLPGPVISMVNQGYYTFALTDQQTTKINNKVPIPPPNSPNDLTAIDPKAVATGKDVSLKAAKEAAEKQKIQKQQPSVKGMRTMRGDVDRLRNTPGDPAAAPQFTKPFKGN